MPRESPNGPGPDARVSGLPVRFGEGTNRLHVHVLCIVLSAKYIGFVGLWQTVEEFAHLISTEIVEVRADAVQDELLDSTEAGLKRSRRRFAQRASPTIEEI